MALAAGLRTYLPLIGVFAIGGAAFGLVELLKPREEARRELLTLLGSVELGNTKPDVSQILLNQPPKHLRVVQAADRWAAETPYTFGAKNWILFIDFAHEKVRCLRVRTADSAEERPADAPEDRCASDTDRPAP